MVQVCLFGACEGRTFALTQVWFITTYTVFNFQRASNSAHARHKIPSAALPTSALACSSALPGNSFLTRLVVYHIFGLLSTLLFPPGLRPVPCAVLDGLGAETIAQRSTFVNTFFLEPIPTQIEPSQRGPNKPFPMPGARRYLITCKYITIYCV